jgi:hypothetical protein
MVYSLGHKILGPYIVDVDNLDGDPQKIHLVDETDDGGRFFSTATDRKTSGRAFRKDNIPTKIEWRGPAKYLADFHTPYGLLSVSNAMKQVVESVEPGIHQFFPVEYVDRKGTHIANRWFMNVCSRLDSIDHEATQATGYVLHVGRTWAHERDLPGADRKRWRGVPITEKLIFDPTKIGDHHLWYDKYTVYGPFLSNELAQELTTAGLKGLTLQRREAI